MTNKQYSSETFSTQDLSLAASILATNKARLVSVNGDGAIKTFILDNGGMCRKLSLDYVNGQLKVSARGMSEQFKLLKDIAFGRKQI